MKRLVIPVLAALAMGAAAFAMTGGGEKSGSGPGEVALLAQAGQADPAPVDSRVPAISVITARTDTLVERVIASGLVEPVEQVFVQPEIEGQAIRSLAVDVGDKVQAGQTLAMLAETSLQLQKSQLRAARSAAVATIAQLEAQIVEAQASADEARRSRDRTASLADRGMVSQASLDQAASALTAATARASAARESLKAARAQLEGADAQIDNVDYLLTRTAITAPVAGTVIARNARVGAIAAAGANPMFVLMRDSALEVRADVAERDLLRLQVGQPALINVAGLAVPLKGSIRLVEPTVDAVSRLGRVRIALDNADAVRGGMFADASIEVGRTSSIVLPSSAVGRSAEGATVLRVDDGVVSRVPVTAGARTNDSVAIVDGLTEGATVVARAGGFVRDGDRIRPVMEPSR